MFRQGQLAVHGLAILLGRNEAGISNRGKFFLHHAVFQRVPNEERFLILNIARANKYQSVAMFGAVLPFCLAWTVLLP